MRLVSEGVVRPGRLFADNTALETTLFLGDWGVYRHIEDLCNARQPLLSAKPYGAFRGPLDPARSTEDFRKQELSLTSADGGSWRTRRTHPTSGISTAGWAAFI